MIHRDGPGRRVRAAPAAALGVAGWRAAPGGRELPRAHSVPLNKPVEASLGDLDKFLEVLRKQVRS